MRTSRLSIWLVFLASLSSAPLGAQESLVLPAPRYALDESGSRFYVQRIATREVRPKEGVHAPSEMTLDWSARRASAVEPGSGTRELLRFRGLKTGSRNRHGEWVEIDSRAPAFAAEGASPKLREQVQRLLAGEFEARFGSRGELLALEGADALFPAGERHAQRVEELRSMLRLARPILPEPSAWSGVGTRWTYELRYLVSNWLGGHALVLRVEAEAHAIEGDVLVVREKLQLVGDGGRVASGYAFREGRGELRYDLRRGRLEERKLVLAYGEPGFGAEYEVELRACDEDPFAAQR